MKFMKTNRQLCEILWNSTTRGFPTEDKIDIIMRHITGENAYTTDQLQTIKNQLSQSFYPYYHKKWNDTRVARKRNKFEQIHHVQLDTELSIDIGQDEAGDNTVQEPNSSDDLRFEHIDEIPVHNNEENFLEESSSTTFESEDLEKSRKGRPSVPFEEGSRSTQERLASILAEEHITPEFAKAFEKRKEVHQITVKLIFMT